MLQRLTEEQAGEVGEEARWYMLRAIKRIGGVVPYMGPLFYSLHSRLRKYANINTQLSSSGSLES